MSRLAKAAAVAHSSLDDYSYCDRYADIANARIGKFANIAAFSRIGATDHPLHTAACHHFSCTALMTIGTTRTAIRPSSTIANPARPTSAMTHGSVPVP